MKTAPRSLLFSFFFLIFNFFSCSEPQTQVRNDFYLGLKSTNPSRALSYFERALTSNNLYIRRAAAQEIAALSAEGIQLTARTEQRMRQQIHGSWALALDSADSRETALSFLLDMNISVPEEARLYALKESEALLSEQEFAAVNGHYAIFNLRYNEALLFFRTFQQDGEWPVNLPGIFITYPILINDLGRAFQYTSFGREGISVFTEWEKNLGASAANQEARYRLRFFTGRIARRNGQRAQAKTLFERSLEIAPNSEQTDACIWYILDLALNEEADVFMQSLEQYISRWTDKNYYNDILERFLHTLVSAHDWDRVARTFNIIKNSGASIKAGYAWTLVRVIEEGYETSVQLEDKIEYLTAAYNAGGNDLSSTLYYRGLSAASLGRWFYPDEPQTADSASGTSANRRTSRNEATQAMQFINGFFAYNAQEFAMKYILQLEKELAIDELRETAGILHNAGMYVQSIRLAIRYTNREDYPGYSRRDIELLFPCPYRDLVEKYAREFNIPPELLFGLIRTESAFQSAVVSRAGAVGLTQLIPSTAEDMANRMRRAGGPDFTGENLNLDDPEQNIHIGAYYLNYLINRFEDKLVAILAYNGGMNRIRRLMEASELPPDLFMETLTISETRDYGRKVLGAAEVYRALYYTDR